MYYLYKITNLTNGKCYLGITNNPKKRFSNHKSQRCNPNTYISKAIKKYGIEHFEFQILVIGDEVYIKELEVKAIVAFNTKAPNGYNLTDGGEGRLGCFPSIKTKGKLRQAALTRYKNLVERQNLSRILKDRFSKPDLLGYRKGAKNPKSEVVSINGIQFACMKDASTALNIPYHTIKNRFRRKTHPEYNYV